MYNSGDKKDIAPVGATMAGKTSSPDGVLPCFPMGKRYRVTLVGKRETRVRWRYVCIF